MKRLSRIERTLKERFLIEIYKDIVIDYLSKKLGIPRGKFSIMIKPLIGYIKPDLILVYGDKWFIIEFRPRPFIKRDLEQVLKYKNIVEQTISNAKVIPVLAYIYSAPKTLPEEIRNVKPLIILHLIGGSCKTLYESL